MSSTIVLVLCALLTGLIVLLIFFYKKLNKEAEGKYTVRNIVYRKGGIRDRMRDAALAVGTRLGAQRSDGAEEDGEELQEIHDEEGQVEDGGSQGSDSEGDEEEEGDDDDVKQSGKKKGKGEGTSDDSNSEGSQQEEQEEQAKLMDQQEAKGETEEEKEKVEEGEGKGEASGGTGLLIDLKQFSGSAIWSEEGGENKDGVVTAL